MKYYIGEYWAMMNSCDPIIREEGVLKWDETAKNYGAYFQSVKDKLPKRFIKEYEKNDWFHDFAFDSINVSSIVKGASKIELIITNDPISYKISLSGVTSFSVDIPSTRYWMCGKLTWGYSEFELNDDGAWIIRILCDFECELEILFRRISISVLGC